MEINWANYEIMKTFCLIKGIISHMLVQSYIYTISVKFSVSCSSQSTALV